MNVRNYPFSESNFKIHLICHILLGYIYFSISFIFVSPCRCPWNYFTTRVERDLNMMIQHP